jgi:pyruvate/2-oxoglutarate/acetoin dehydrogenase E1 component
MPEMAFGGAIDAAVADRMAADESVIVFGEDVALIRRDLAARFGAGRVRGTPISESAFLGAGVGAAMAGLRPVVEIMLVDFIGVCFDALLNHAAKLEGFTGGRWNCPMVVRATCGGGYGDAGQHEQVLASLLAGVPGLDVVLPSTPADAAGLMAAAIDSDGPVVFLEHKVLSEVWLDWMGGTSREGVDFSVPAEAAKGDVALPVEPVPLGKAILRRPGDDVALVSAGAAVHHCIAASEELQADGVGAAVLDLRTVSPLDTESVCDLASRCGKVVVVDEDYLRFGLSGEIAAVISEAGISADFARIGVTETIPYAARLESAVLPQPSDVVGAVRRLL